MKSNPIGVEDKIENPEYYEEGDEDVRSDPNFSNEVDDM